MWANAAAQALLATPSKFGMFTNTPSPAVPAVVLLPPVLARRSSTTFYAVNPQLLVLANTATATIFALVFVSAVWAKAASTILALQAH
jgi:hypothetical protein